MSAMDYTDVESVKSRLDNADTKLDQILAAIIPAASRAIDAMANRRFYQITETRWFTAPGGPWLEIDDLVSISALATDISGTQQYDSIWATTDYNLDPFNAAGIGFPYTAIRQRPFTARWFPSIRRGVQVTGAWGWPAVPPDIVEATILQVLRLFLRKNSPYGVAGQGDFGRIIIPRFDPDVSTLVAPYVKQSIGFI